MSERRVAEIRWSYNDGLERVSGSFRYSVPGEWLAADFDKAMRKAAKAYYEENKHLLKDELLNDCFNWGDVATHLVLPEGVEKLPDGGGLVVVVDHDECLAG